MDCLYFIRNSRGAFVCADHYETPEDAKSVALWLTRRWKVKVLVIESTALVNFDPEQGVSLLGI